MQPAAVDKYFIVFIFYGNAELFKAVNRCQTIGTLLKAGNFCCTFGDGAKHNASVRNGFIAGNSYDAF